MSCPPPPPPPPPHLLATLLRHYVSLRCGHPRDQPPTPPLHQQIAQLTSQYTDQTPYPLPPLPPTTTARPQRHAQWTCKECQTVHHHCCNTHLCSVCGSARPPPPPLSPPIANDETKEQALNLLD